MKDICGSEMNLAFALSGLLIDLDNLRRALPNADASSPSGLIRGTFKIIRKEI